MSDTMSDTMLDIRSDTSSDETSDDLEQLWKEAIEHCEHVEKTHSDILSYISNVQTSISISDTIMVSYQGEIKELGDILDSIHQQVLEQKDSDLSSVLLSMLETCEFIS